MKITGFELFKVPPRWLFLKVNTDEGISGWGEPVLEGRVDTTSSAVGEFMELLLEKDPLEIEDHWNTMYRGGFYRGGPVLMSALSGIDQALWDIKGKYLGAPVHQLMGGKARHRIRAYMGIQGDTPEEIGNRAAELVKFGYTALKMNGVNELQMIDSTHKIDRVTELVNAVREAIGDSVDLAIDLHGRVHKPMAKPLVKALEPFRPLFIEEPVLPEHNEALRDIAASVSVPLATGERMFSRWHFKGLLEDGFVDIIQPDVSHAGGITECKKILSMAEAYDVAAALHCPLGPIALASCMQINASCYNAFIQEQVLRVHDHSGNPDLQYVKNPGVFTLNEGFLDIPSGPGLGIEVNEQVVRDRHDPDLNWRNPIWRHPDGSFAEW